jgi:hypothetical protein
MDVPMDVFGKAHRLPVDLDPVLINKVVVGREAPGKPITAMRSGRDCRHTRDR